MEEKFDLTFYESELRVLDCALWMYIKNLKLDRFDILLSEIDDFKEHFAKVIALRLSIRSCFDVNLKDALTEIENG